MKLYFSPLACSMASRMAIYETGTRASFVYVHSKTKVTDDGQDYLQVHPLALVPALQTDQGELLTENAAILQYLADTHPTAGLAPVGGLARARLHQWLSFIGTELHKATFGPLLDARAPEGARLYAVERSVPRLHWVNKHLGNREFLLDRFSVADAYLVTVLGWAPVTPITLEPYPALERYVQRIRARPAFQRAFSEEYALYASERSAQDAQT